MPPTKPKFNCDDAIGLAIQIIDQVDGDYSRLRSSCGEVVLSKCAKLFDDKFLAALDRPYGYVATCVRREAYRFYRRESLYENQVRNSCTDELDRESNSQNKIDLSLDLDDFERSLCKREREFFRAHRNGEKQKNIAARYHVSDSAVSQIMKNLQTKLRRKLDEYKFVD